MGLDQSQILKSTCTKLVKSHIEDILSKRLHFKFELEDVRYKPNEQANYLAWCRLEDLVNSIISSFKKLKRKKKLKDELVIFTEEPPRLNETLFTSFLEKETTYAYYILTQFFTICYIGQKRKVLPSVFNDLKEKSLKIEKKNIYFDLFTCDGNVKYHCDDIPRNIDKKSIKNIKNYDLGQNVIKFYQDIITICARYKAYVSCLISGEHDSNQLDIFLDSGIDKIRYTVFKITANNNFEIEYSVYNVDAQRKKRNLLAEGRFETNTELDSLLKIYYDKRYKRKTKDEKKNLCS